MYSICFLNFLFVLFFWVCLVYVFICYCCNNTVLVDYFSLFMCEISPSALKASDRGLDTSSWKCESTCGLQHKGGDNGGLFHLDGDPEDVAMGLLVFLDAYSPHLLTESYGHWRIWKRTLRGLRESAKMSIGVLEAIKIFAIAAYYRAHPYKTDCRCKFTRH